MNNLPTVKSGKILIYRFFDVAYEIDLGKVEEKLKQEAKRIKIARKPFSKAFEFADPPVSLQLKEAEIKFNDETYKFNVYSKAYDYGVVSVMLELSAGSVPLTSFEELSVMLEKNDDLIDRECRNQLTQVTSILGESLVGFNISRFEEDYTIFYIESFTHEIDMSDFLTEYDFSKIILPEEQPLSDRIKNELMAWRFSYYANDCVILNFDNALIIEPSGSMEIPDILEFANAQLLELRYYDSIVDRELDNIYDSISTKGSPSIWKIRKYETLAAKFMKTITDLSDVTEKIDNSLKVTEDVYYARIYMSALRLFRVKEWEQGIRRKLEIASNVNDMLYREISTKRIELLELAIVILILSEIIIFFFRE